MTKIFLALAIAATVITVAACATEAQPPPRLSEAQPPLIPPEVLPPPSPTEAQPPLIPPEVLPPPSPTGGQPLPTPPQIRAGCSLDSIIVDCVEFYNHQLIETIGEFSGNDCGATAEMSAAKLSEWNNLLDSGRVTVDEAVAMGEVTLDAVEELGVCEGEQLWHDYYEQRSSQYTVGYAGVAPPLTPPTPTPMQIRAGCSLNSIIVDCVEFYNHQLIETVGEFLDNDCGTAIDMSSDKLSEWTNLLNSGRATVDEAVVMGEVALDAVEASKVCEGEQVWHDHYEQRSSQYTVGYAGVAPPLTPPTPTPMQIRAGCSLNSIIVDCVEFYNHQLIETVGEFLDNDCGTAIDMSSDKLSEWTNLLNSGRATVDEAVVMGEVALDAVEASKVCEGVQVWHDHYEKASSRYTVGYATK